LGKRLGDFIAKTQGKKIISLGKRLGDFIKKISEVNLIRKTYKGNL